MQNPDSDLIKMKDQLEYLFVKVLVSKLKKQEIHANDIRPICQGFLNEEPFASIQDAHKKINIFVASRPDFSLLKEYADVYYDEDRLDEKLEVMRKHLKDNNIDEALKTINQ